MVPPIIEHLFNILRGCLGGKPGGGCGRDDRRLEGSFSYLLLSMGADCSTSRATIALIVELYTVYSNMSMRYIELGLGRLWRLISMMPKIKH